MLKTPLPLDQRRHPRSVRPRRANPSPPAPVALNLVAAGFDDASGWVRLTFDRPIDAGAVDAAQITVNDGPLSGTLWVGVGATSAGPAVVVIGLEPYDPSTSAQTVLTAGTATGIVSANDGGGWGGVTDLELPFP